jgi:hypothetical protein
MALVLACHKILTLIFGALTVGLDGKGYYFIMGNWPWVFTCCDLLPLRIGGKRRKLGLEAPLVWESTVF